MGCSTIHIQEDIKDKSFIKNCRYKIKTYPTLLDMFIEQGKTLKDVNNFYKEEQETR